MGHLPMKLALIAPCGMNCGVCRAHLRLRDPCPGCRNLGQDAARTRVRCKLRQCDRRKGKFCFACESFPCSRLKQLDARYRKKYGMSEIDNLLVIRDHGIRQFLAQQRALWCSEQGTFCVHDRKYYK